GGSQSERTRAHRARAGTPLRGGASQMVRPMMLAARENRTSFAHNDASEVLLVGASGCVTFEISRHLRASVAFHDSDRGSRRTARAPIRSPSRHALHLHVARASQSEVCDLSHVRVCRRAVSVRGLASGEEHVRTRREPRFSDHETKLKPSLTLHKELVAP